MITDESIERLTRDLLRAGATLTHEQARFLVDSYYIMQKSRIRGGNQVAALTKSGEPHDVLQWFATQGERLEARMASVLKRYADAHPVGVWLQSIDGIGPILAAGLLAHIDIEQAPTVGHIWSYAGLDPTKKWEKGQKRPWNSGLKTLCWKIGESFVKVSGKPSAVYGHLYLKRKEYEIQRNEAGDLAEQAAACLAAKRIGKDTDAYKAYSIGKLPPAHIHARAKRYAVKQFLADLHHYWYVEHHGKEPPLPYPVSILGHAHIRKP